MNWPLLYFNVIYTSISQWKDWQLFLRNDEISPKWIDHHFQAKNTLIVLLWLLFWKYLEHQVVFPTILGNFFSWTSYRFLKWESSMSLQVHNEGFLFL